LFENGKIKQLKLVIKEGWKIERSNIVKLEHLEPGLHEEYSLSFRKEREKIVNNELLMFSYGIFNDRCSIIVKG
jgi:hypothetical protein